MNSICNGAFTSLGARKTLATDADQFVAEQAFTNHVPTAETFAYRVVKRAFELLCVLAMTPAILPLVVIICIVIRCTSPGPVFYSHPRLRRNGETFRVWKFRTMHTDSDTILKEHFHNNPRAQQEWSMTQKLRHDPRVTVVGHALRRYSLDELPQLWNVLNGTMSLVGPRPITTSEIEKYGEDFSTYCTVNPGLTGLWQISGRCELSYPERVKLDVEYIHFWSLLVDLSILAKTAHIVISGRGAY